MSAPAAVSRVPQPGRSSHWHLFCPSSGNQKYKVEVLARLFSPQASLKHADVFLRVYLCPDLMETHVVLYTLRCVHVALDLDSSDANKRINKCLPKVPFTREQVVALTRACEYDLTCFGKDSVFNAAMLVRARTSRYEL